MAFQIICSFLEKKEPCGLVTTGLCYSWEKGMILWKMILNRDAELQAQWRVLVRRLPVNSFLTLEFPMPTLYNVWPRALLETP